MLHDIEPHVYSNAFHPRASQPGDVTLCFCEDGVYLKNGEFPRRSDYPAECGTTYLFDYDGAAVHLSDRPPEGAEKRPFRAIRSMAQPDAFLGGTAQHLWDWYRKTKYCGCCGSRMEHSKTERAMVCPQCGNTVYPRISPAVIVLIHSGDRILLAQGKHYTGSFYSLIAGYLEIGESLEQAVCREALEEAGVHVHDLRYFGNQPWPFTDTQMVGFFAEGDPDEPIVLQEEELADARWFRVGELPETASGISIASAMITAWKNGFLPQT